MKFVVLLLSLLFVQSIGDSTKYRMFLSALENETTSPNYVLVLITDLNTYKTKEICTEAPFLEGAIHKELKIDYDSESEKNVKNYLKSNKDLHYALNNKAALENIGFYEYDENELSKIKRDFDLETIIDSVNKNKKYEFTFEGSRKERIYFSHLLLLNNINVRRGCFSGNALSLELFDK